MSGILKGNRPDITPAQIPAIVLAVATVLSVFGVYDLSTDQQNALVVAGGLALTLIVGDAKIRGDRNKADATVAAAGIVANGTAGHAAAPGAPPLELEDGGDLVGDEEELASPPPPEHDDISAAPEPTRPESGIVPAPPND
jgi:hypothetical protein